MKIDKDKFLFIYQESEFKSLGDSAKSGLTEILTLMESDQLSLDIRWCGYALATTFHECAGKWQPIEEFDKGKGRSYGVPDKVSGQVYYGRGYVQLTWRDNYAMFSRICGADLINKPQLALQPDIAYRILSYGMRNGTFTGVGLKKYFNDTVTDPINARRIINGTDCAELIAGYYDKFMRILSGCKI